MASKQQVESAARLATMYTNSVHTDEQHQRMRKVSRDQSYTERTQRPEIERSTEQQPKAQSAASPAQYQQSQQGRQQTPSFNPQNTRITNKHILFWHGPLSNWSTHALFSGARVLELLLPRLDDAGIKHPSEQALSTRLLARHNFNCGEQFMMACKGWLFERSPKLEEISEILTEEEMEKLCQMVMGEPEPWATSTTTDKRSPRAQSRSSAHSQSRSRSRSPNRQSSPARQREPSPEARVPAPVMAGLRNSTIARVLKTYEPREQKALGRKAGNFDDKVWAPASKHVVVAASIARAETDPELRKLYHFAGNTVPQTQQTQPQPRGQSPPKNNIKNKKNQRGQSPTEGSNANTTEKTTRTFVEGSPVDRIWGVGLRWNEARCDDEKLWRGENRLGRCHDEAAKYFRDNGLGLPSW